MLPVLLRAVSAGLVSREWLDAHRVPFMFIAGRLLVTPVKDDLMPRPLPLAVASSPKPKQRMGRMGRSSVGITKPSAPIAQKTARAPRRQGSGPSMRGACVVPIPLAQTSDRLMSDSVAHAAPSGLASSAARHATRRPDSVQLVCDWCAVPVNGRSTYPQERAQLLIPCAAHTSVHEWSNARVVYLAWNMRTSRAAELLR